MLEIMSYELSTCNYKKEERNELSEKERWMEEKEERAKKRKKALAYIHLYAILSNLFS